MFASSCRDCALGRNRSVCRCSAARWSIDVAALASRSAAILAGGLLRNRCRIMTRSTCRIDRSSLDSYFKVYAVSRPPPLAPACATPLAGVDLGADRRQHCLVVAVDAHIAVAVIDNQEVSESAQPFGVDDLTDGDRSHGLASGTADQPFLPARSAAARGLPNRLASSPRVGRSSLAFRRPDATPIGRLARRLTFRCRTTRARSFPPAAAGPSSPARSVRCPAARPGRAASRRARRRGRARD